MGDNVRCGNSRAQRLENDSYMVNVFRPVAEPHSRHLITPSADVDEASIDHVLKGGGLIGGRVRGFSANPVFAGDTAKLTFQLDLVVFEDGEIAGPDPDLYAAKLQSRRPAAEFIAKQVRMARAEHRDVTPVLSALAEAPFGRGDPLACWIQHYARDYLRHKIGGSDAEQAALQRLENLPRLPEFYRRHPAA